MSRRPIPAQRLAPRPFSAGPQFLVAMMVVIPGVLIWLALRRHDAFWTARFDVGNMWQAVWNTAHGDVLLSTDPDGHQVSRLAGHVDPLLVLFAPLAWVTTSPAPLLVTQVVGVSLGAIPMYALGRRWHGDGAWPLASAAAYLLSLPLAWTVLDEFHPVAFAAPLLVAVIWAIETRHNRFLALFAVLAVLSKEEVGLAVAIIGVWMAIRHHRPRAGALLSLSSLAWVAVCLRLIIPHFNDGKGSKFVARYGDLGATGGEVVRHVVTHPWEIVTVGLSSDRLAVLALLAIPLLLLPFGAPLLALAAAPEVMLNGLADWQPQHSIEFHYVSVPAGILLPAAILGAANLRQHWADRRWVRKHAHLLPGTLVAAALVALVVRGPLPWFGGLNFASPSRLVQYDRVVNADALDRAVARIPEGAVVSATNNLGGHLSARHRVLSFPVVQGAQYVVVDRLRPTIGFRTDPARVAFELARLRANPAFRLVSEEQGVRLFARLVTTT